MGDGNAAVSMNRIMSKVNDPAYMQASSEFIMASSPFMQHMRNFLLRSGASSPTSLHELRIYLAGWIRRG